MFRYGTVRQTQERKMYGLRKDHFESYNFHLHAFEATTNMLMPVVLLANMPSTAKYFLTLNVTFSNCNCLNSNFD